MIKGLLFCFGIFFTISKTFLLIFGRLSSFFIFPFKVMRLFPKSFLFMLSVTQTIIQ